MKRRSHGAVISKRGHYYDLEVMKMPLSAGLAQSPGKADDARRPHRVVIIGSGFGGLFAAKALRRAPVEVTLIAKTTHHLFQPLLYQVATGILSQGEIAPATREVLKHQRNVEVLLGEVNRIDLARREVTSVAAASTRVTPYDSLIVAAGSRTAYFGHDEFERYAPGLKSVDDALELRGRIFTAFEMAELADSSLEADRWMTFVVVGAGATGVEMAGQIIELSRRALRHDFHNIDPSRARVVLLDGADEVLASFGHSQSEATRRRLERMGIEIHLGARVTGVDALGVDVLMGTGETKRIEAHCKIWAAGVAASPLARQLAEQTGASLDRAGRIGVNPDLTLPGHPEVFVVGDMIDLDDLPGVAQVAIQGGRYAAHQIKSQVRTGSDTGTTLAPGKPFRYFDKGSMATISRFRAVCNIGKLHFRGFIAWLLWAFVHLFYLIGFQKRVTTLLHWVVSFVGTGRAERAVTTYQALGAMDLIAEAQEHDNSTSGDSDRSAQSPGGGLRSTDSETP